MRRTATPAITPQMYRHFATFTVAITALIAFFANGENQKAAAAATVVSEAPVHQKSEVKKPREDVPPPANDGGGWGPDNGDFGQASASAQSNVGTWVPNYSFGLDPDNVAHARRVPPQTIGDDPADSSIPSASDIAAANAAARARSGAAGGD